MELLLTLVMILGWLCLIGIATRLASQPATTWENPVETIQRHCDIARQAMDQTSDLYLHQLSEQLHNSERM